MQRLCDEGVRSYLGSPRLMPERATVSNRSEESAEVVVATGQAEEAEASGEGPNEKECSTTCRRNRPGVRCPRERGERPKHAVKLRAKPQATKPGARGMSRGTQGQCC